VQENSGSVGAGWSVRSETWAGCDRVAVVELGVNSGSGDGGSCSGIEVWTDIAKLTNNGLDTDEILSKKRCSSNMKPMFRAKCVV